MTPAGAADVSWWELHHAFGLASDMAELLAELSTARGRKLRGRMTDLCNRVLHQGTIYSASPPAVHRLIPMAARADGRDRVLFYEVLAGFAAASRKAIRDGCAIACCAGGDPKHGSAILAELLAAHDVFSPDLSSPNRVLRRYAAELLCCSSDAGSEAARMVRNCYRSEPDPATRQELLNALIRVRGRFADWAGFLSEAIQRESDPNVRFTLRQKQIGELQGNADSTAAADLISTFLAASETEIGADCGSFLEALQQLGRERHLAGLLEALQACRKRDVALAIAERLLRLVFDDSRSGWEATTYSIVAKRAGGRPEAGFRSRDEMEKSMIIGLFKIVFFALLWSVFPVLLRRKLRKQSNERHKLEYGQVEGPRPDLPKPLTPDQQTALAALSGKPEVWVDQTNLWSLFGLPDNAANLQAFLAARI